MTAPDADVSRRTVLRGAAAAGAVGSLGAAAQPASAQSGEGSADAGSISYGGWFDESGNFEGTVDERGSETVRITVGAEGNGGNFAFDPAAVQVDPGTTIVWEWSGGSSHDVVAENGAFQSELVQEAGHTFEWTAEGSGITRYACTPHRAMGMRGAIVVGEPDGGPSRARIVGDTIAVLGGVGLGGGLLALVFGSVLRSGSSDVHEP